ncbi:hypothetical protein LOAG_13862, partial [Loa loa]
MFITRKGLFDKMNTVAKKNSKKFQSDIISKVCKNLSQSSNEQVEKPYQKFMMTGVDKKRIKIYKNGDESFEGVELIINMDQFKNMQTFLDFISEKIGLTNSAKKLYTLNGDLIKSMEQIVNDKGYVATTDIFTPLFYGQMNFTTNSGRTSRMNSKIASSAV